MTTIYTTQGKVLKNTATDKWLIKHITPPVPMSSLLYSDIETHMFPYTYNINADLSNYSYCTVDYDISGTTYYTHANGLNLNPWGWEIRNHYQAGDQGGWDSKKVLRNGGTFTATNPETKSEIIDGATLWYADNVMQSAWGKQIFILDRENSIVSAAINNTVYGYGDVNTGISSLTSINCYKEVDDAKIKDLNVIGFNSITAINDYYNL